MEKTRKPRKKKIQEQPLEAKLEKMTGGTHRAEIRDGVVIIVPETLEIDLSDPRNELVGQIKEEELQVNAVQGIITVRKTFDNEVQYVVDDHTQLLAQKQAKEARARNQKNQEEEKVELKTENYKDSVVVESESYKDLIEILNYQDSGKLTK